MADSCKHGNEIGVPQKVGILTIYVTVDSTPCGLNLLVQTASLTKLLFVTERQELHASNW